MKTKEDKNQIIAELTEMLKEQNIVYLADIQGLNAEETSNFRRMCFKRNVKLQMVKNTLLKRAFENSGKDFSQFIPELKGSSAIMLSEIAKDPAVIIKEFRKKGNKPTLKGAALLTEEMIVIGDDQLDFLANIKSKEELVADVVLALKSSVVKVASALQTIVDKDAA
ncbi:MAG: 50S ribosomal protein L10 [Bacteroidales bacterium]|nr:50S ribosomal protein L10 [Bacteroidales bacterium]